MSESMYQSGEYLQKNPTWSVERSPWKAGQIVKMLGRHDLHPQTVCDVGCGAGEVLAQLQRQLPEAARLRGYEISPQAFELCASRTNDRLEFVLGSVLDDPAAHFDLVLALDVVEHVEDYFGFLRGLKGVGEYKLFHIPLDMSVREVLFGKLIMKTRQSAGHLHYFMKETALQSLRDTGYEVVDWFYTAVAVEGPGRSAVRRLAGIPLRGLFALSPDATVRLLGGWSLMVLAR